MHFCMTLMLKTGRKKPMPVSIVQGEKEKAVFPKCGLLCGSIITCHLSAWLSFLMKLPLPESNDAVCWKASFYVMYQLYQRAADDNLAEPMLKRIINLLMDIARGNNARRETQSLFNY